VSLFIGLMSGTSLDGVDGVLARVRAAAPGQRPAVLAHVHAALRRCAACRAPGAERPRPTKLHRAALAANALMRTYAGVVSALLRSATWRHRR
jgi:anhydro-N-acetylmuramic acid kinase